MVFEIADLVSINFSDFEITYSIYVAMNLLSVSTIFNENELFAKIAKLFYLCSNEFTIGEYNL